MRFLWIFSIRTLSGQHHHRMQAKWLIAKMPLREHARNKVLVQTLRHGIRPLPSPTKFSTTSGPPQRTHDLVASTLTSNPSQSHMSIDPFLPCNFANGKLSFYVPSDFSIEVLEHYGAETSTILFGFIPPNARFEVTRQVLATLVEYAYLLPNLECVFSCSGRVAGDVGDEDLVALVRAFRGLKSIYLD